MGPFCVTRPNPTHGSTQPMDNSDDNSNSVCLMVTATSSAKTHEPVEVPFGMWTFVGLRNHVRGRSPDPLGEGVILGHLPAHCNVYGSCGVCHAKADAWVEIQFWLCTRVPIMRSTSRHGKGQFCGCIHTYKIHTAAVDTVDIQQRHTLDSVSRRVALV